MLRGGLSSCLLIALLSCAPEPQVDGAARGPIDARWQLKAGDGVTIRAVWEQTQDRGGSSGIEMIGTFHVRGVGATGEMQGEIETIKFRIQSGGDKPIQFLYEGGTLKESSGLAPEESQRVHTNLQKAMGAILLPTGTLLPKVPGSPLLFLGWPLGVGLPGKTIAPSDHWKGTVRAAYSDVIETDCWFSSRGDRMRITGRSTEAAEESHKIRVRMEGTYVTTPGYVADGRIEIDFSPLGQNTKTAIQFTMTLN